MSNGADTVSPGLRGKWDPLAASIAAALPPGPHPLSRKPGAPTQPLLPEAPSESGLERQFLLSSVFQSAAWTSR